MEKLTWEQWLARLDAIADRHGLDRCKWDEKTEAKWRARYEAGMTPQKAWDDEPWRRA